MSGEAAIGYDEAPHLDEFSSCREIELKELENFRGEKLLENHVVKVCLCPACYVKGAGEVLNVIEGILGIKPGETTKNGRYTLETAYNIGHCVSGPNVMIDGHCYNNLTPLKVLKLLRKRDD